MKRSILLIIGATVIIFIGYLAYLIMTTRSHSPEDTVTYQEDDLDITVSYCRPYKKGRKIFGGLVPYGEYWRTGANDATEITFSRQVQFGNKTVEAGRYRLYTIPNINEWQIVLNSELGQWGAFKPNNDLDVASVVVPTRALPNPVEQFTIFFDKRNEDLHMHFQWDKTEVFVPIK